MIKYIQPNRLKCFCSHLGPYLYYFKNNKINQNEILFDVIYEWSNKYEILNVCEVDWDAQIKFNINTPKKHRNKIFLFYNGLKRLTVDGRNEHEIKNIFIKCIEYHNFRQDRLALNIGSKGSIKHDYEKLGQDLNFNIKLKMRTIRKLLNKKITLPNNILNNSIIEPVLKIYDTMEYMNIQSTDRAKNIFYEDKTNYENKETFNLLSKKDHLITSNCEIEDQITNRLNYPNLYSDPPSYAYSIVIKEFNDKNQDSSSQVKKTIKKLKKLPKNDDSLKILSYWGKSKPKTIWINKKLTKKIHSLQKDKKENINKTLLKSTESEIDKYSTNILIENDKIIKNHSKLLPSQNIKIKKFSDINKIDVSKSNITSSNNNMKNFVLKNIDLIGKISQK